MWWSEDSFVGLVFSFHIYVNSRDAGVWVCLYLYWLRHLASSVSRMFTSNSHEPSVPALKMSTIKLCVSLDSTLRSGNKLQGT